MFDTLFRCFGGPTYREEADRHVPPGWFDRIVADWDTGLRHDLAAMDSWTFDANDADRLTAPVLNMTAAEDLADFLAHHPMDTMEG